MSEYRAPGVYVDEAEAGPRPIEGVSTSTAGFVGVTERGPVTARPVTSFEEFERLYGRHLPVERSSLPFAVRGFFENGGRRCFVGRIASPDATPARGTHDGTLSIAAIGPGTWGNRIAVKIEEGSAQAPDRPPTRFKLTAMYWGAPPPTPIVDPTSTEPADLASPDRVEPALVEVYDNLCALESSVDFYETRITGRSSLIEVRRSGGGVPALLPEPTALGDLGAEGTDGSSVGPADYEGRELPPGPRGEHRATGLRGFERIDEIAIVCAPDHHRDTEITAAVVSHCERTRDRFAVLHSHPTTDTLEDIDDVGPPRDTSYAAFYFPWIETSDPISEEATPIPPSGHVAGIYARTDSRRGVFTAPANAAVRGAESTRFPVGKRERDILGPRGVNVIRSVPGRGIRVWGARTSSSDPEWRYVPTRRFLIFLEQSIQRGIGWAVFEPNDGHLWAGVRRTITEFLTAQWRAGALRGKTSEEAFFVKVDRTTMTQDDIDDGRLVSVIGVAPVRPAEFVIFRIHQKTGQADRSC